MNTMNQEETGRLIADLVPTDVLADMLPKLQTCCGFRSKVGGNGDAYKVVVKALGRRRRWSGGPCAGCGNATNA